MFRKFLCLYVALSLAMIATSVITGYRASTLSGKSHYLETRTTVWVEEEVPADNPADAARDQAMREAGESTAIPVKKPCFVLGLADATIPTILAGGFSLAVAWLWRRRRLRRSALGQKSSGPV
ncbi:MAG TPA: hypothetical protein VMV81_03065 [Phycisphaerae bacterium]|nr:hypothetical protein [Phycisphaerae bacterium]